MSSTKEGNETDKIDKYVKGLVSTLGHIIGLREGRDGKLHATVEDASRDCISIENINVEAAQQWEPGALLKSVAEMNIVPPEKVEMIRKRVDEVSKSTKSVPKRTVPTKSSTSISEAKNTGGVPATKAFVQEDPFALSKGPSGFYAPRKVPTTSSTGATPKSMDPPSAQIAPPRTTLFSGYEQPASKKPALGSGNYPTSVNPSELNKPHHFSSVGRGGGMGVTGWNNASSVDPRGNLDGEDARNGAAGGFGGGPFKTAYEQLVIDDKRKGIQRNVPPPGAGAGTARASGLRRPPPRAEPERNSRKSNSDDEDKKVSDNPEVEELMSHESMKNVDAKMVEAILNEVMETCPTHWDDIAGLEGVKKIIREIIIWPMERPDIFTGLRAAPRGILFFGPPGTGKTMFGKVIATESRSTFFNISASSLTSKWIGDGEKMVRALFSVARLKQPSVIFIDEIDSILTQRSDTEHESSRRLKTEFLIQFDGCATTTEDRILVIGVTNRPQELDEAARRRLVKRIYIPLPDFVARKQLVKNLIKEYTSDITEQDYEKIAKITEGYSGADMTSLCREASYGPIREIGERLLSVDVNHVRPMRMKDFIHAQRQVKSSVATSDVTLYEDWDAKFGCHIGGSIPDDYSQSSQD